MHLDNGAGWKFGMEMFSRAPFKPFRNRTVIDVILRAPRDLQFVCVYGSAFISRARSLTRLQTKMEIN